MDIKNIIDSKLPSRKLLVSFLIFFVVVTYFCNMFFDSKKYNEAINTNVSVSEKIKLSEEQLFRELRLHEEIKKNNGSIFQDYDSLDQGANNIQILKKIEVSQKQLSNASTQIENWIHVNGNYSQDRFYPGNEINKSNVNMLRLTFTVDTGVIGTIESAPLVFDGIMYITAAFNNVFAFDAVTGKMYWHYKYQNASLGTCCGPNNRGLAIKNGQLYMATIDGHLISLEAKSGKLVWDVRVVEDESLGNVRCTTAPVVVEDKVILGCSSPLRGFMRAFSASSGKLIWNFYTIPDSGQEGLWATRDATGHDLKRNVDEEKKLLAESKENVNLGGNAWNTPSVDINSRTIFFVTGDPLPMFDGKKHPGDNLYSESILALDLDSGKYKWHFQYIPHDLWDLDFATPTILGNAKDKNGKIIPVVMSSGKMGNIFVHNRLNGDLIRYSEPMIPQRLWETDKESFESTPNGISGVQWSPMAFNSKLNYMYALNVVMSDNFTNQVSVIAPYSSAYKFSGSLVAVDVNSGKIKWKFNTKNPLVGGVLASAGDLVFFGEGDGSIRALDAELGTVLWQFKCDAGANGVPISYEVYGKQYIAIGCGGHTSYKYRRGSKFYVFNLD